MPLYDFKCPHCGCRCDRLVATASDYETVTCPTCGTAMVRQPSAPAFTVKGYNAKTGYSSKED